MALANYTDLKAAIADHLHRSDLTNPIVDWIALVEERCNNELRHPAMEETATLTLSSRAQTLPTDFLEMIRAYSNVNTRTKLTQITPEYGDVVASVGYTQAPYYKLEDGSLYCFQQGATTVDITYYEKIPPMASNSTNWLLTRAPSVYLYGACLEGATYLQDDERAAVFGTLFNTAWSNLKRQGMIHKFGRMTMKQMGQTP